MGAAGGHSAAGGTGNSYVTATRLPGTQHSRRRSGAATRRHLDICPSNKSPDKSAERFPLITCLCTFFSIILTSLPHRLPLPPSRSLSRLTPRELPRTTTPSTTASRPLQSNFTVILRSQTPIYSQFASISVLAGVRRNREPSPAVPYA